MRASETQSGRGFTAAAVAYTIWGVIPVYLKQLHFASPGEVLANRILWSVPFAALAVAFMGGFAQARDALRTRGVFRALVASAALIAVNWWIYVWAVSSGPVIEASLAYFLTPFVNVAFGMVFFKERLGRVQAVALALAAVGVLVQTLALGAAPVVALALCGSWSLYGLVRKQAPVPAAAGLFVETCLLAAPAAAALMVMAHHAPLGAASGPAAFALLSGTGPITAVPLILFAYGARRLTFATLGLLQFIAPSLQFLIGVAYGEALTPLRLASFALIWIGLALFSLDALRKERAKAA